MSAQYAADIGPLAMFFAWRALKLLRFIFMVLDSPAFGFPAVPLTVPTLLPCCPNRIVFILPWLLATTMCDFVGCPGVRFGLLKPETPARFILGSAATIRSRSHRGTSCSTMHTIIF